MVCPLGLQSDMVWCSGITRRGTKALPGITPNQNRIESGNNLAVVQKAQGNLQTQTLYRPLTPITQFDPVVS